MIIFSLDEYRYDHTSLLRRGFERRTYSFSGNGQNRCWGDWVGGVFPASLPFSLFFSVNLTIIMSDKARPGSLQCCLLGKPEARGF